MMRRETEKIKNTQSKHLEIKNINRNKEHTGWITGRWDTAEEKNSELEDMAKETTKWITDRKDLKNRHHQWAVGQYWAA